ncbi:MFS transporter [Clostridium muellerianum]|nr:MFS transporter [Clostridium muellerianum]
MAPGTEHSELKNQRISKNAALYLCAIAFYYISSGAFSLLQGIYIKELHIGETFLGSLLSLRILATALFSIPGAMIVNKYGKKKGILLGICFVPVTSLFQGYFENKLLILIFATLQGCAMSFLMVSEGPFFMENGTEKNRLKLFSYSFADNVFATMLGYFIFGHVSGKLNTFLGSVISLRYSIITASLMGMIGCIFAFLLKENNSVVYKNTGNFYKDSLNILKQKKPSKFLIYNFIIGFGAGLVVPYFNVYLKYKVNITTEQIGIIMSLSMAAMGIGGLITPIMARRYGKVKTIITCQIVSIPFLMLIAMPPSIIIVSLALFIRNALMNMTGPIVNNMAMELVQGNERSIFASMNNISNNLSMALSAVIAGIIMNHLANGYEIPYFITAIMYFIATLYFYKYFKTFEKVDTLVSAPKQI